MIERICEKKKNYIPSKKKTLKKKNIKKKKTLKKKDDFDI